MTLPRTFPIPRTFDNDLPGLVELLLSKNFSFSLVDILQCQKDAVEQREARARHDALQAKYLETHAQFAVDSCERYGRFVQLLNAARVAYRDDKAMMAALQKYTRKRTRRSPNEEAPQTSAAPQPSSAATQQPAQQLAQPLPRTATA